MPASASDASAVAREALAADAKRLRKHDGSSPPQPKPSGPVLRSLLRSMLGYLESLIRISRSKLFIAVLLMTLTSLTEGLGVALLFPILEVAGLNMQNQGHVGHYTAEVQSLLRSSGLRPSLWLATLLMIFMLLMALRSLFSQLQSVHTLGTVLKYEMGLSQRLYQAIIHADWLYLAPRRSSDFTHALTGELSRVANATYQFVGMLASATLVLVYTALAMKLSALTTLMVIGAGAALLLISRGWIRAMHESGAALSDSMREIYAEATEHLQNLKAIKTYDAQAADLEMFRTLENSALKDSLRTAHNQAAASFWFEAGSLVVLAGVIFISLRILRVGPASILLLLAIFTRLMPRLAAANSQFQAFLGDLPAFENVMELERECEAHAEADAGISSTDAVPSVVPRLAREVLLERICFRYEPQRPWVLDQLSLAIAAGEITAIAGPSGAGKSTIADIVNGLLVPASGRVLMDGVELAPPAARAWRRQVGYVAQDTLLFHNSVRANLLWARPEAGAGELEAALRLAAAEFVFELPRGLDTIIGDRGVLLSNGQRQRIALARALLRKPSLLILDEATNSIDPESESRILDAIEQLKRRTTVLMIAHRASAIERADSIYIVEQGRVVESGTWTALSSQSSSRAGLLFRLQGVSA